jgi:predicted DNA-binding transcriptional regulator AlpA
VTAMQTTELGDRYLSIKRLGDKLSRGRTWIFDTVRDDPSFPRPFVVNNRKLFSEAAVDAWIRIKLRKGEEA